MTGARRYGPRKPKDEHAGGRDRPAFIKSMTDDQVRAYLMSTTISAAAQQVGVSEASIKNYEREFGARCKRYCQCCNKVFAYDDMFPEKDYRRRFCHPCKEAIRIRAITPDRELMALELRDPFANYARMSLTRRRSEGVNGWRWGQAWLGAQA